MADSKRQTCVYCKSWIESPVKSREGLISRKCKVRNRLVIKDSESCRYFNPDTIFWCEANQCRLNVLACLQRRRNRHNLKEYTKCKNCRQFDLDLQWIVQDYYFNGREILDPEAKLQGRTIKRRAGSPRKRKIKRREKPEVRKIKRRKKPRKIKRRQ